MIMRSRILPGLFLCLVLPFYTMDNSQIAESFSLLSQLMDIHGENSFRSKSYAAAAFAIKKMPIPLSRLSDDEMSRQKGIGNSTAQKIREILNTGTLASLEDLLKRTPPGVVEMLHIKGIGPKKINMIWREMGIENPGELLYACRENRLKLYKGFGEKTQQNVIDSILFYFKNKEWHLYAQVEIAEPLITGFLKKTFPTSKIFLTGAFTRQMEIIKELEYVIAETPEYIRNIFSATEGFTENASDGDFLYYKNTAGINIKLYPTDEISLEKKRIETSCSVEFLTQLQTTSEYEKADFKNEESFFSSLGLPIIPLPLRELAETPAWVKTKGIPNLITTNDIRGIIHCHSNWSDGEPSLEEMVIAAKNLGVEYLVLSDHSRAAFYANGLSIERVKEQHTCIDELNRRFAPFRIFKSIESDILNDGQLDYPDEILANFDMVIASVHSNLKMPVEKAMKRLLTAIQNPFTTILGHLTGRLLLTREGYPLNLEEIIDACLENQVTIELNANPNRLDIDWRHIRHALNKGVKISINPDAHYVESLTDIKYGVLVAQKAGLTREENLSSMTLDEFENFLSRRKAEKAI